MLKEVDVPAFAAARERGALVLDVREAFEFADGHVPGARWVPLGMLADHVADLPRDRAVMVICASGNRSLVAAELLTRAGLDAASVRGGTTAWARSGRELSAGIASTRPPRLENSMDHGIPVSLDLPFAEAVDRVRSALAEHGFGVLTEIDVRATMKAKLGEEMDDFVILGACNPPLAHRALQADPRIGLLLPCNVVVRANGGLTVVEAMDPQLLVAVTEQPALKAVAEEAASRLRAALGSLAA